MRRIAKKIKILQRQRPTLLFLTLWFIIHVAFNNLSIVCHWIQTKCYIVERFHLLSASTTFVDIDDEVLHELVSDDRLVFMEEDFCVSAARQEQLLLESVLRYVRHDETSRIGLLGKFLTSAVRLQLIPPKMMFETRESLAEFPRLTAAFDEATDKSWQRDSVPFRKRGTKNYEFKYYIVLN